MQITHSMMKMGSSSQILQITIQSSLCQDPEPFIDRKFRERRHFDIKNIVNFKNRLSSVNWEGKFVSGSALHNFTEFYYTIKFLFHLTLPKEKL